MHGAEIDHVLMHLNRMNRKVREKMIDMPPGDWDGIEWTDCIMFLNHLKQAHTAVLKFRIAVGNLQSDIGR